MQISSTGIDAGEEPRQGHRNDERYPSQDAQNSLAYVRKWFGTRFRNVLNFNGGVFPQTFF